MYRKEDKRFIYDGDFEQFLLSIGVEPNHIKRMKVKKLQEDRMYYSSNEDEKDVRLVPLEKVIGTSRGTVGDSVFENVRTMFKWERDPSRFNNCFSFLERMSLNELRKSYENLYRPVEMIYYKDDDEYFVSTDGNHRALTAMLIGAQSIRANVTVEYCDEEKKKKYLFEKEFYRKYNILYIMVSYSGYKIVFTENNVHFEVDGYERIIYNEDCYSTIRRLSIEIEKDRMNVTKWLELPDKLRNVSRCFVKNRRWFQFIEKRSPSDKNCNLTHLCFY